MNLIEDILEMSPIRLMGVVHKKTTDRPARAANGDHRRVGDVGRKLDGIWTKDAKSSCTSGKSFGHRLDDYRVVGAGKQWEKD